MAKSLLNKLLTNKKTAMHNSNPADNGARAELQAALYVQQRGLDIIKQNYRCRYGEIDLIAQKACRTLVFIEVRMRNRQQWGSGEESVDLRKQKKIITTAQLFLQQHRQYEHLDCRFDVISVTKNITVNNPTAYQYEFKWIKNAFDLNTPF